MGSNDLVGFSVALARDQHRRLKALSARTHVPIAIYIRQGIERVLRDAENDGNYWTRLGDQGFEVKK